MSRATYATLVLGLFALCAQAQVTKCTDAGGSVTYTNKPCASAEKARTVVDREAAAAMAGDPVEAAAISRQRREIDERTAAVLRSMAPREQSAGMTSLSGPGPGNLDSAECRRAQHNLKVVQNAKTFKRDAGPEAREMRAVCGLPEPVRPEVTRTRRCTDEKDFNCYR